MFYNDEGAKDVLVPTLLVAQHSVCSYSCPTCNQAVVFIVILLNAAAQLHCFKQYMLAVCASQCRKYATDLDYSLSYAPRACHIHCYAKYGWC